MTLVNEDEHGAYLGVRPEFLKKFTLKESNPNFEIYDSVDGNDRFVVARCSRLPDDEDAAAGKYGINFHRAKPTLQEARQYHAELPDCLETRTWLNDLAFAAKNEADYDRKSRVWEHFYSYIWDKAPQTIWVTPHSGNVNRPPDATLPYPKLELDAFVAGAAASCAYNNGHKKAGRTMISIHSHNWFGAVLDLGGFGIIDDWKLADLATKIEEKYHQKARLLADECKHDFSRRAITWLEHIGNRAGTLDPRELESYIDRTVVLNITIGLKLYEIEVKDFTLEEFRKAIRKLQQKDAKVVSCNHLFPAKHIGKLLDIGGKVSQGLLTSALQVECMKLYLAKDSGLVSEIILDIKDTLFGE